MLHLSDIRDDVCSGCWRQSWGFDFYYDYEEAKVFFCLRCLIRRLWDCLVTQKAIESLKAKDRNLI